MKERAMNTEELSLVFAEAFHGKVKDLKIEHYRNDPNFRPDKPCKTVQTQIGLLLEEEQSDQGLYCLSFNMDFLDKFLYEKTFLFEFEGGYSKPSWCLKI